MLKNELLPYIIHEGVNPKSSHHMEKKHFFSISFMLHLHEMMDVH